ncbi:MAG: DUF1269 domain-containing protein [Pseudomonadota bacterium]
MPDLVAVTFPDHATAFELRAEVVRLQGEYLIALDDAVVVTRAEDGKVDLHQATNLTASGAVQGSIWGLLIGTLFLSPLFGAALGAGAGAFAGAFSDIGINDQFMRDLAEDMQPGSAATFLLVREATPDKVVERLKAFRGKGKILQTSLTADSEEKLRAHLEAKPET